MKKNPVRIAIVGGGASGTITAINLLRKINQQTKVYLIEKRKVGLFRGAAYSSKLDYEPLNVEAGRMSLYSDKHDHFFDWLLKNKTNEKEITRGSFVSRRWFGEYLAENIQQTIQEKNENVSFKIIDAEVIDISKSTENSYTLQTTQNDIEADIIIIATGNESPADVIPWETIFSCNCKEKSTACYVLNPWLTDSLSEINTGETVLFIGTGLTMADHVVSLKKRKHTGKIFALSRNGLLPKIHKPTTAYKIETQIASEDIHQLVKNIENEIEKAKAQNLNWREVIFALRPLLPELWQTLSDESKSIFLKEYKTKWEIHRHQMPPATWQEINELIEKKLFSVLKGNIVDIAKNENEFTVFYKETPVSKTQSVKVNRIINCTGPSGDYEKINNPLFKNLLAKGFLKKDTLNLGIVTGKNGEIIQRDETILQNTFSVGPVRKAAEWESTAIREIRHQAEELADFISEKVNNYNLVLV